MKFAVILLVATLFIAACADNYAVIVAGSNGFYNYRHQSDACHAYHLLLDKGNIKPENIILFSYGDVAGSPQNPYKNQLFNKPTAGQGIDVNAGCKIDYSGKDVTPANYLKVLRGQKTGVGSGKTLTSTSEDNVFLAFFDHGATGLIAFPSSYLYATDLQAAVMDMYTSKMYNKLVYYLEACESGSMFSNWPKNINAYALSASSPSESSWGCYCPPNDVVNGKHVGSCLGDLFAVSWMEDSDLADFTAETLQTQFTTVKRLTNMSQVMQWGDITWTAEVIGNYLGKGKKVEGFLSNLKEKWSSEEDKTFSSIDSRDIKLQYFVNRFQQNPSLENYKDLTKEINQIKYFNDKFGQIKSILNLTGQNDGSTNYDCYKNSIAKFESSCGKVNEYGLKFFTYFAEICATQTGFGNEHITNLISQVCSTAF